MLFFLKDTNSVFHGSNETFAKVLRVPKKDVAGIREEEEDKEIFLETGHAKTNMVETHNTSDGQTVQIRTHKGALRNKAGQIIGIIGCFTREE